MKIYRVEHMSLINDKFGGPAGPYGDAVWFDAEHEDDIAEAEAQDDYFWCNNEYCTHSRVLDLCRDTRDHRPTPGLEENTELYDLFIKSHPDQSFIFGFDSMDALMVWFVDDLWWLEELGYVVGIYEVDEAHVYRGHRQLVFNYDRAARIEEMN